MKKLTNPSYLNGLIPSPIDVRDYTIASAGEADSPVEFALPLIPVKDQFTTPSCAAFAGSEIVEYFNQIQKGEYVEFSTEFIYGLREKDYYIGDGMCLRDVCKTLLDFGDVPCYNCLGNNDFEVAMRNVESRKEELLKQAFPNRVSAYFKLETSEEMKRALMKYGYLLASMNTYQDAYVSPEGMYIYNPDKPHGCHAIVIYGWNESGWLMQNSWGAGWGKKGRCILPKDFKFNEIWGFTDDIIEDGEFKFPFSGKFIGLIARLINIITNFFKRRFTK